MPGKLNNRLEWAQAVAVEAGQLAVRMRTSRPDRFAQRKSNQDFVTAADLAVEDLIRQRIGERYPEEAILGALLAARPRTGKQGRTRRALGEFADLLRRHTS